MIRQIRILNFQSHKETVLDLHEGVNALVGLTGSGKSVVFKALDWLFRNKPLGEGYRSWWGGDTRVEILLDEGQRVGRVRTDSDNYYYIDEQEFRAFGKGLPPKAVLDLLNLSDVNFQAQADPAFLISNNSGEVARYLNKAAHLDVIDEALVNIGSVLRKEKEDLIDARRDLEQAQVQLTGYDWLPEAEGKLAELEALQFLVLQIKSERSVLTEIVGEYERVQVELSEVEKVLAFAPEMDWLIRLWGDIEKGDVEWEVLAAIVDQYEEIEKELTVLAPLEEVEPEVGRLLKLNGQTEEKSRERDLLSRLVREIEETNERLGSYARLPEAEREFVRLQGVEKKVGESRVVLLGLTQIIEAIGENEFSFGLAEREKIRFQTEFDLMMPSVCPLCGAATRRE